MAFRRTVLVEGSDLGCQGEIGNLVPWELGWRFSVLCWSDGVICDVGGGDSEFSALDLGWRLAALWSLPRITPCDPVRPRMTPRDPT